MSTGSGRARLRPDERREQLLELGVRLLATRSLDEVSIDLLAEEAGISRGLLYHYFGGKTEFHEAVVRRAADQLFAVTAPTGEGTALEQLAGSLERYVDYVTANHRGYLSLVRGAMGGHEDLRKVHEEARSALTGRLFDGPAAEEAAAIGLTDTPLVRLVVHGWAAYVEDLVLEWVRDPAGITREELLGSLAASLPGLLSSSVRTPTTASRRTAAP
ncbi:TetR/AcrR family transcriptional regulator [Nocardioides korecus]